MGYAAHIEALGDATTTARALRSAAAQQHRAMLLEVRLAQSRLWLRRHALHWLDRVAERTIALIRRSRYAPFVARRLGRPIH